MQEIKEGKRFCSNCKEWKELEAFSPKSLYSCRICNTKLTRNFRKRTGRKRGEIDPFAIIPSMPGKYNNETQKTETYKFMKALGFKLNESNGVWFKKGFKTKEGKFNFENE